MREVVVALAGLALAGFLTLLALGGRLYVPGAAKEAPGWLMGVFGGGIGYLPERYLTFLLAAIVAWAVFSIGIGAGTERRGERQGLWVLIGALVLVFTLAPPLHSLDVFSYISYGRLQDLGLNPYEHTPAWLVGDPAADRVDAFRFTVSAYGPLFTLLTALLAKGSTGFALWSLKIVAGLSVLAVAALTMRIARLRGVSELGAAAFVGLNPIVLAQVLGGAHNDALMVALALAGVLAVLSGRPALGGVGLAVAAGVKVTALLYAPFALVAPGRRMRVGAGLLGGLLAIGLIGLAFYGGHVVSALGVLGENQDTVSSWSVAGKLSSGFGIGVDGIRAVLAVAFGALVIWLLFWTWRGGDWIRAAGWATFGLLVASAWMTPWYLIWLLPFAAVSRDRALVAVTILFTLFQAANGLPL